MDHDRQYRDPYRIFFLFLSCHSFFGGLKANHCPECAWPVLTAKLLELFFAYLLSLDCEQSLIFLCQVTAREKSSTRVAKPRANITSWFAIAPAEIRTRQILRENRDRKQSILSRTNGTSYTYLI